MVCLLVVSVHFVVLGLIMFTTVLLQNFTKLTNFDTLPKNIFLWRVPIQVNFEVSLMIVPIYFYTPPPPQILKQENNGSVPLYTFLVTH